METSLQDVMATLNFISVWLADHDVCLHEMAMCREAQQVPEAPHTADNNRPSDTQPMDVFDGMEDAVRRQVAKRLRGPTPACPATTDEESGDELPPESCPRRKLGRLRTADNAVVSHAIWPQELIYPPSGQPAAVYETLSIMSVVNGYIEVLNIVNQDIKLHMLAHLQELMVDGEMYRWQVILNYHAAWLQHIKQGRATWGNEPTKLKLRRPIVWHRVPCPLQTPSTSGQIRKAPNTTNKIL